MRAILGAVRVQPSLRIPLSEAVGHVLAADVIAQIPLPPWTNAAMDGYAARASDVRGATRTAPRRLHVTARIAAGDQTPRAIGKGEAMRIFTGGRVPDGADSVIRQEDTDAGTDDVLVHDERDAGANVREAGGDLARGATALAAGTTISPRHLAVLAALGVAHPVVHRRPRVGILATGDEVVALDHPEPILTGAKLADVNGPTLTALVQQSGGIPVPLGIAADDDGALRSAVEGADDVDLLITAGGVSVGDRDHVRDVMATCGVATRFDRVRIRPGGPTAFGLFRDGRAWLALPGNPVSAMVTFELFGRPAIRAMAGHPHPARRTMVVTLGAAVRKDAVLDQYLRCALTWPDRNARPVATPSGPQGSGMLMSMMRADCLAIIPAGSGTVAEGAAVEAQSLDGADDSAVS